MRDILKDIKVLDISSVLAGPSVGMFFAELGADVLKIENPKTNGDITRHWKNPSESEVSSISAYYASVNAFKKVELLDLTQTSSREKIYSFLESADIVITNFKYGDDIKLKLDYDTVKKIQPQIIYAKISGFGDNSSRIAYDLILQAETGFMYLNREPQQLPNKMPVALIDVLAAHQLKEGILLALYRKLKTNKGAYVHCSLYDAAVCSLINQATNYLISNYNPPPMGSKHPNISPYGEIFETKDHQLITFAIGSDKQFSELCKILELSDISNDVHFSSNLNRVKNREQLYEILQSKIKDSTSEHIYNECINHDVPVAIIKDIENVLKHPLTQRLIKPAIIENHMVNIITSVAFEIL